MREIEKESLLLKSRISELYSRAEQIKKPQFTKFLNIKEQKDIPNLIGKTFYCEKDCLSYSFYGGYDNSERKMLGILPTGYGCESFPIKAVFVKASGYHSLNHRDYLGSILSLGIARENIGDVLVDNQNNNAYILLQESIVEFILSDFISVGKDKIICSEISLDKIPVLKAEIEEIYDTVSSLRLDCVVSSALRISRNESQKLILSGLVRCDYSEVLYKDMIIDEGSLISIKGKGRYLLKSISPPNRKGKFPILIYRYK